MSRGRGAIHHRDSTFFWDHSVVEPEYRNLSEFFDAIVDQAYGWARRWVSDGAEAEDVVMLAFETLSKQDWRKLRDPAAFLWILVRNEGIRVFRRRNYEVPQPVEILLTDLATTQAIAQVDIADALRRPLLGLPTRQRQAIALVYFDGLTRQEAATVMGITENTVNTHVERALVTLSAALKPEET